MSAFDWSNAVTRLNSATPSPETDRFIEEVVNTALPSGLPEATAFFIKALEIADNVFVRCRVALALSSIATDDDVPSVDALANIIKRNCQDEFLYIGILKALGLLAERSALANAEILPILLRLKPTDSPFLLIQAAKIIGRLESVRDTLGLRKKLAELGQSNDLGVQAEVFQQQALLALADALRTKELVELGSGLQEARLLFIRAQASEENRDDASAFVLLLDLILEFFNLKNSNRDTVATSIAEKSEALLALVSNPYAQSWYGYRTKIEQLLMLRILHISNAFKRIAEAVAQSDIWTNFDEALVDLAATYSLMLTKNEGEFGQLDSSISDIAPNIILPRLGPVVMKATGRVRFEKVIERYVAVNGENEVARGLRAIYDEALKRGYAVEGSIDEDTLATLSEEAKRWGETPDFFLNSFLNAIENNGIKNWAEKHNYSTSALSIDNPALFGNSPQIDIAVRKIFESVKSQLEDYPQQQWNRFMEVCEAIVQIVHLIRDDLPLYALSASDSKEGQPGKGQNADERDLQKDLFQRLRLRYGSAAEYEVSPIGGGRSDIGLKFAECEFPIEVKAEYKTIEHSHFHDSYVAQPDIYASMRDRVAFILILDLRATNSGQIPKRRNHKDKATEKVPSSEIFKLYSLEESFWVDGLSIDPQVQDAKRNAVVFGLVPGNRSKPSSMTYYSRKPPS